MDCIIKELKKIYKYVWDRPLLNIIPEQMYTSAGKMLMKSDDLKIKSIGLWASSRFLKDGETITVEDTTYTKYSACLKALEYDPLNSYVYISIGCCISKINATVNIDGKEYTKRELCVQAIKCDPTNSCAYASLAISMKKSSIFAISLSDKRRMNGRELYLESLKHDPSNDIAYVHLARTLTPLEIVIIPDGRVMNEIQLYMEALRHNSQSRMAYNNLGTFLEKGEHITLPDGRSVDDRMLYLESLKCKYTSPSLINLGLCLSDTESICIPDGRIVNKYDLYLEALKYDADRYDIRNELKNIKVPWSRRKHECHLYSIGTNILFATLFLGIQTLEEKGVVTLAHQAVFEDMLQYWNEEEEDLSSDNEI